MVAGGEGIFRYRRSSRIGRAAELGALGVLILIFIAVAMERIWLLRTAAERSGVAHTVGAIRSSLGMRVARNAVEGQVDDIGLLAGTNPMAFLDPVKIPPNYLGELRTDEAGGVPGYRWYFDKDLGQLVYVSGNPDALEPAPADRLVFEIAVQFADMNGNHRFDGKPEYVTGISLEPVGETRWREP